MRQLVSAVAVIAVILGSWILLGLWGLAIEAPVKAGARWVVDAGGPWAAFGLVTVGFAALTMLTRYYRRRDLARQYAADRTIHVEASRWTPAFKRRLAWMCLPIVLVLGKIVVDTLIL